MNNSESQIKKLQELTITKKLAATVEPEQVAEILHKHGWRMLGLGFEAAVAEHPGRDYVLKVFPTRSKYTQFVKFCRQRVNNPHLPRFSRYVRPVPGTAWSYVRMEHLTAVKSAQQLVNNYLPELVSLDAAGRLAGINTISLSLRSAYRTQLWDQGVDDQSMQHTDPHKIKQARDQILDAVGQPSPAWSDMIDDLAKLGADLGVYGLDLHEGNFMLRDQTLVVTDPLV